MATKKKVTPFNGWVEGNGFSGWKDETGTVKKSYGSQLSYNPDAPIRPINPPSQEVNSYLQEQQTKQKQKSQIYGPTAISSAITAANPIESQKIKAQTPKFSGGEIKPYKPENIFDKVSNVVSSIGNFFTGKKDPIKDTDISAQREYLKDAAKNDMQPLKLKNNNLAYLDNYTEYLDDNQVNSVYKTLKNGRGTDDTIKYLESIKANLDEKRVNDQSYIDRVVESGLRTAQQGFKNIGEFFAPAKANPINDGPIRALGSIIGNLGRNPDQVDAQGRLEEENTSKYSQIVRDKNKNQYGNTGAFAGDAIQTTIAMAPVIAGTIAAGPAGTFAAMYPNSFVSSKREALSEGATPEQAERYGAVSGAAEAGFEMLSLGKVLRVFPGLKNIGEKEVEKLVKNGAQNLILNFSKKVGQGALAEGASEAATDATQQLARKSIYKPDAEYDFGQTAYSAALGATVGVAMGAPGSVMESMREKGAYKEYKQYIQEYYQPAMIMANSLPENSESRKMIDYMLEKEHTGNLGVKDMETFVNAVDNDLNSQIDTSRFNKASEENSGNKSMGSTTEISNNSGSMYKPEKNYQSGIKAEPVAPDNKWSTKYNVRNKDNSFSEVKGQPVKSQWNDKLDMFVYKTPNSYIVADGKSGLNISQGNTPEEAIQNAEPVLNEHGHKLEQVEPIQGEVKSETKPKIDNFMDSVSKNDIDYERAKRAHNWNSFDPEKMASQIQDGYVKEVQNLYDEMKPLAKTEEQQNILIDELTRYKEKYIQHTNTILDARSRTASAAVTGPAKFPTAKNQKALDVEAKRVNEFLDWNKKARTSIKKKIELLMPADEIDKTEFNRLKKEAISTISTLKSIEAGNKGYDHNLFRKGLADKLKRSAANGNIRVVKDVLKYIQETESRHLKKPVFSKNNAIWKILDIPETKNEKPKSKIGTESLLKYDGAEVVKNNDADRVQIFFDEKPGLNIVSSLKKEGWNFSPSNKAWQRKITTNAEASAKRILDNFYEPVKDEEVKNPENSESKLKIKEDPTQRQSDEKSSEYAVKSNESSNNSISSNNKNINTIESKFKNMKESDLPQTINELEPVVKEMEQEKNNGVKLNLQLFAEANKRLALLNELESIKSEKKDLVKEYNSLMKDGEFKNAAKVAQDILELDKEMFATIKDLRRELPNAIRYINKIDKMKESFEKQMKDARYIDMWKILMMNKENMELLKTRLSEQKAKYEKKMYKLKYDADKKLEQAKMKQEKGKYVSWWEKKLIKKEADQKLKEQRQEAATKQEGMKKDFRFKLAKQKYEFKENLQKKQQREGYVSWWKEQIKKQESALRKEQGKILTNLRKIASETKFLRPEYKGLVENILKNLDLGVKQKRSTKKIEKLEKLKRYIEENPDHNLPESVLSQLSILSRKPIGQYTIDELRMINQAVSHLVHLNNYKNTLIFGKKVKDAKKMLLEAIENIKMGKLSIPEYKQAIDALLDAQMIKLKMMDRIKTFFTVDHYNPEMLTQILDGQESGVIKQAFYDGINKGTSKMINYEYAAKEYFQEEFKKIGVDIQNWSGLFNQKIEGVEFEGGPIASVKNLTRGQRISLYLHSLNDDNMRHILKGGFSLTTKTGQAPLKLEMQDFKKIIDTITPQEKKVADVIAYYFDNISKKAINETSVNLYGYELANVDKYFPIKVDPRYKAKKLVSNKAFVDDVIENMGMLKSREKGSNPILIEDAFEVVLKNVEAIGKFNGLAEPLRNAKFFLRDAGFQNAIIRHHGMAYLRYLNNYIDGLEELNPDLGNPTMNRLRRNVDTSLLGLNPWVVAKQPISYVMEMTEIDGKYLMKALAASTKETRDEIKKWSPELRKRLDGDVSIEMGEMGEFNRASDFFLGKSKDWRAKTTKGILAMDTWTVMRTWEAAKLEVKENNPGLSGDDLMEAVAERTEEIIRRTQSVFEQKDRSAIGRSKNEITRTIFRFSSQRNVMYNSIRRAFLRYKISGDKKKFARDMILLTFVSSVLIQAVDSLRDMVYGREQSTIPQKLINIVTDTVGLSYGVNEIIGAFEKAAWNSGNVELNAPLVDAITGTFEGINATGKTIGQAVSGETYKTSNKKYGYKKGDYKWTHSAIDAIDKLALNVLKLYGVPYGTPRSMYKGVKKFINGPEETEKQAPSNANTRPATQRNVQSKGYMKPANQR